ncbi:protein ROOT INITIATION DEFECTIVE 3-like [Typha latifolia]|uniref:protein ROOT INITIATION DEFECTIVE 3-like n=1 Tax=Typha latifolia TaxID=4733 RepID=UPI003C2BC47B
MERKGEGLVVVCSEEKSAGITVWDIETGDELLRIPNSAASPHGLLFFESHFLLASLVQKHRPCSGGAIFFWDLNKPQAPQKSYLLEPIVPIASSKDGMYLVGGAPSGNTYIWEIMSGRLLRRWHAHQKSLSCLAFSQDDSLLVSGSEDGTVCVWSMISVLDMGDYEACRRCPTFHIWSKHQSYITGLLTLSSGSNPVLVSSSLDGTCKVRELVSGRLLQTQVLSVSVTAIAVDPAEQLLFSGGEDGAIYLSKLAIRMSDDPVVVSKDDCGILCEHKAPITALAFSVGGVWLISASKDCTACLWDTKSWNAIKKFNQDKGISNLVVIPNSSLYDGDRHRSFLHPRVAILDKVPRQSNAAEGTTSLLPSYCSNGDHLLSSGFRTSQLLNEQILDLEQEERTAEAIQMKVMTNMEKRLSAINTTKQMTEINKNLRLRLLDMMQLRLCQDS